MCKLKCCGAQFALSDAVLLFCIIWASMAFSDILVLTLNLQQTLGIHLYTTFAPTSGWDHQTGTQAPFLSLQIMEYGCLLVLCISSYWGWAQLKLSMIQFSASWVFTVPSIELVRYLVELYLYPEALTQFGDTIRIYCTMSLATIHCIVFYSYKNQLIRTQSRRSSNNSRYQYSSRSQRTSDQSSGNGPIPVIQPTYV